MSRLLALAATLVLCSAALPAQAFTKFEGEYFFLLDLRKQDRRYVWDFDSNSDDTWNVVNLRLFSQPMNGVEAFLRFEAEWNTGNNNNRRPVFQYRDAHLRFRRDFQGWGVDSYLFSRQDRFWVNNHLLRIVEGGAANDGGNAQGARVDFWGLQGANFTLIGSDFSAQSHPNTGSQPDLPVATDDAYVFRYRQEFFENKLRVGMTWNRRNNRFANSPDQYTSVLGFDTRYHFKGTDYLLAFAEGKQKLAGDPYERDGWRLSDFDWSDPSRMLPADAALAAEIRPWRVGGRGIGYFNAAGTVWYYGPQFRNELGNGNNDEAGYWINTWYLIPGRAITWTNNYTSYTKRVTQARHYTEYFSELYVEFVNGFTGKLAYYDRTTRDWFTDGPSTVKVVTENDDIFAEMQVENRLAWMRVQFRIRDLDTLFQKELAAIETSLNISNPLKIYTRFAFGNDPARTRKGLFAELQWRPRYGLEVFLGYGPYWIGGGSNPVFDGNLQGSADNRDLLRLSVKGTF